ncbi:Crp/Fnr family transcriptional regulator [Pseudoduganella buxea]|uniref:Cyclic nucleotide-binding domain-containing protein n=1 Tax=Pseudoduganella buxea TaxID=1949069 RepID=A0A6I3SXG5_9BURK|nr:Crp/Fnr family transcriptional regulator [Pseudoduganella buxea]MTV52367.1 cyclic nucleotide-binding domain-containing protein [Pseudoduganella buxea]GGC06448.1 regulatory protein [Pseudoduganella buxea]
MDQTRIKIQAFLSKVPLFARLRPDEVDRIALGTTKVRVARGELVFQRGEPCVGFHIVVYGQVKLSFTSNGGAEKVIELIGPGHSFGEALMFMNKPYIVTAQATEDSMLLHVSQPVIFREIHGDPDFACAMLAGLSQRMHSLMSDMESYSLRSGTQRVAGYLLKDCDGAGSSELTLPAAKAVLASRLNLTPEHFSRIMADLSARQLIAFRGRHIVIPDVEKLRTCAG